MLDHFRGKDDIPTRENIDTFLSAIDMIKSIFEVETSSGSELPENYDLLLNSLKKIVNKDNQEKKR